MKLTTNGSPAGNKFVTEFAWITEKQHEDEAAWIARLRAGRVAAAHPDDGWVDRENNAIYFAYPQFNDGVCVGCVVALGDEEEYRLVKITRKSGFLLDRWHFREL